MLGLAPQLPGHNPLQVLQGRLGAPSVSPVVADLPWYSAPRLTFFIVALVILGGAIWTITRRNPVAAVMSLVGTFFGLAAAYALLFAHFLAALQVLVYAGAIMTLFVFVVMVLNRDEAEALAWKGLFTKTIGVICLGFTVYMVGHFLYQVKPVHADAPNDSFGTVAEVGHILFTDYLFAFEAVSVLLMIAVIAAVVVARVYKPHEDQPETPHPTLAYGPQGTQGVIGPNDGDGDGAGGGHDDHGGHH